MIFTDTQSPSAKIIYDQKYSALSPQPKEEQILNHSAKASFKTKITDFWHIKYSPNLLTLKPR